MTGPQADLQALAQDCVCFANGAGGQILIGVEDADQRPPPEQPVDPALPDRIRKRVSELTVNVQIHVERRVDGGGGEYIVVHVPRAIGVASTSNGRNFQRVGDTCRPVVGDDVLRLASDRPSVPWETPTSLGVPRAAADPDKVAKPETGLRASDRVKPSVKEKSPAELLDH